MITVNIVSPAPGTPILRSTPLIVDVTSSTMLMKVYVSMSIGGQLHTETVHRGGSNFEPTYTNPTNDRSAIAGGFRFTLLRDGGWPGTPILHVDAVDLPTSTHHTRSGSITATSTVSAAGVSGVRPRKLGFIIGQSDVIGMFLANAIPGGYDAPYPAVQFYYRHAKAAATTWLSEGWTALKPRSLVIDGVQFPAGTAGVELSLGRYLAENDPGSDWYLAAMGLDGAEINKFVDPAFPAGGPSLSDQIETFCTDRIAESGADVVFVFWLHGQSDAGLSTTGAQYLANENTLETVVRGVVGNTALWVNHRLTSTYGNSAQVRYAQEGFCVGKANARFTLGDHYALRDGIHLSNTAYRDLGLQLGAAVLTAAPSPRWKAVGIPSQVSSASNLTPSLPVFEHGDVAILVVGGIGTAAYAAPAGWTPILNQVGGGVAAQIRTFGRVLQTGDTAPEILNVGGGDSKSAIIFTLSGVSGLPVASYGAGTTTAGTTLTAASGATIADNSLIVWLAAHEIDSNSAQVSSWACTGLSVDEQIDICSAQGSGTAVAAATARQALAGAFAPATATIDAPTTTAVITLVFSPAS